MQTNSRCGANTSVHATAEISPVSGAIANGASRTHSLARFQISLEPDRPLFVGELDDEIDDPGTYLLSRVSGPSVVVGRESRPDVGRVARVVPLRISLAPKHVVEASGAAHAASSANPLPLRSL